MADGVKLDVVSAGLSFGILWALGTFVLGLIAMTGYGSEFVELLSTVYLGYAATFVGSLIGLVWGFVDAFIGGALIVWLYNMILEKRSAQPAVEEKKK